MLSKTIKQELLHEKDMNCNAHYIYTFIGSDDEILEFDRKTLKSLIYFESGASRLNAFENFLWGSPYYGYDNISEKIIKFYFKDNNYNSNCDEVIHLILNDFYDLCDRYRNYQNFLLFNFELFTQRKFVILLVLLMEEKLADYKKLNLPAVLLMLIKSWHLMNLDKEMLEKKFIPLAFSKWYRRYPFFDDFFCITINDNTKIDFYNSFLNSIIECPNENRSIKYVNDNIEKISKKYCHKIFYKNWIFDSSPREY